MGQNRVLGSKKGFFGGPANSAKIRKNREISGFFGFFGGGSKKGFFRVFSGFGGF